MMGVKRWVMSFGVVCFFIGMFFLALHPWEYDIWFHLKSGEIFAKEGIFFYDVFSQAAPNRPWYPYEWLYQVAVYWIQKFFGLTSIAWVTAGLSTLLLVLLFILLRYIFAVSISLSVITVFSFFALVYDFLTARPQVPAAILFFGELILILLYVTKKKNFLWISIPITFLWANMHASVIFAPLLFIGYALTSGAKHVKVFLVWAAVTAFLTILPPLGTTQYRLFALFWQNRALITGFIDEWIPLNALPWDLGPFLVACVAAVLPFGFLIVRRKHVREVWLLATLIPLVFTAFFAVRNLLWAYMILTIVFAWSMGEFMNIEKLRWFGRGICIVVAVLSLWLLWEKKQPQRVYVPDNAVQFLKTHHINGNMFNGFGVGGYLLYHLYPEYRVFIDGRADVYLCCEIPDLVTFLSKKNLADDAWKKELDALLVKYGISFVIHTTKRHTVSRRIGELLQKDPAWSLVYWGDDFQILVKRDGKNDEIIKEFGVVAATPLELTPYKKGMEEIALAEYERMLSIVDSARSRNAIGMLLMERQRFDEAREQFTRAIGIEPLFDSPYMNLGELAVQGDNYNEAIQLYEKALRLVPNRGFTYIRLGQLYWESGNIARARDVWKRGLTALISEESKAKLNELLSQLSGT